MTRTFMLGEGAGSDHQRAGGGGGSVAEAPVAVDAVPAVDGAEVDAIGAYAFDARGTISSCGWIGACLDTTTVFSAGGGKLAGRRGLTSVEGSLLNSISSSVTGVVQSSSSTPSVSAVAVMLA